MKNFLLLPIFCFFSLIASSQVVTGVYKGKMEVDSPRYTVDFELTLKEKNGKLYGYCHRLFIVEDVLYYNLVKVTARIADSVLIVEDEKSVSNNFKEKTSGVKTVMFFKIQTDNDTVSVMPGEWSTSRTKRYLPITGSIAVRREQNYLATQLYKRLEDKQLSTEMLFEERTKPKPVLVSIPAKSQTKPTDIAKQETNKTEQPSKPSVTKDVVVNQPTQQTNQPVTNNVTSAKDSVKGNTTDLVTQPQITNQKADVAVNQPKLQTNQPVVTNTNKPVANKPVTTTAVQTKDSVQASATVAINKAPKSNQKTDVAVNQPKPQTNQPVVTNTNKPVTNTTTKPTAVAVKDSLKINTSVTVNPQKPVVQKNDVVVTQPKQEPAKPNNPTQTTNKQTTAVNNKTETKPAELKPIIPAAPQPTNNQQTQASITSIGQVNTGNAASQPKTNNTPPVINNPMIVNRQMEIIDALEVTEDSVVLSLYDNGEIDGDTVSVFLNNELVVSKVGLRANAFKQSISLKPGETIQLTLFAENLGSIPPNTGLLVITTGNERYQVHFTSTLNKSSSIVLRRKE